MALLFMDGFDHYATADLQKKWTLLGANGVISSSEGRRSGGCFKNASGAGTSQGYVYRTVAPITTTTLIVGFALEVKAGFGGSGPGQEILSFWDGVTTLHCSVGITAAGAIAAYRNGSSSGVLLGTSAATPIAQDSQNYIEVKATVHDTTGAIEVRVNGVAVLTLTNVDTRNAGTGQINLIRIGQVNASGGAHYRYDDLYVSDTTGSTNNNYLGDVRIDTLYPTSDGNYAQFTPSTGTDHYALVDEATPNTTDYNDGAAVNDRDSYGMGNLAALSSQTVYGVQVNAAIMKDDAGAKSAATFVRSSSTNGDGASTALGTSQVYVSQVFETDPNGSIAWTESSVNAMEAGVKVTA